MATEQSSTSRRNDSLDDAETLSRGHDLTLVTEWVPGKPPTDYDVDLTEGAAYKTTYWRCRKCGQERNRPADFREVCAVSEVPDPVTDGGYSIEEPRTRRALCEDMTVRYGERGPRYEVHSESGNTYTVDVAAATCSCPDHEKRAVRCKHLRRVDLSIRAGTTPGPDGTFSR